MLQLRIAIFGLGLFVLVLSLQAFEAQGMGTIIPILVYCLSANLLLASIPALDDHKVEGSADLLIYVSLCLVLDAILVGLGKMLTLSITDSALVNLCTSEGVIPWLVYQLFDVFDIVFRADHGSLSFSTTLLKLCDLFTLRYAKILKQHLELEPISFYAVLVTYRTLSDPVLNQTALRAIVINGLAASLTATPVHALLKSIALYAMISGPIGVAYFLKLVKCNAKTFRCSNVLCVKGLQLLSGSCLILLTPGKGLAALKGLGLLFYHCFCLKTIMLVSWWIAVSYAYEHVFTAMRKAERYAYMSSIWVIVSGLVLQKDSLVGLFVLN